MTLFSGPSTPVNTLHKGARGGRAGGGMDAFIHAWIHGCMYVMDVMHGCMDAICMNACMPCHEAAITLWQTLHAMQLLAAVAIS